MDQQPVFYDPTKTYDDNFDNGPFSTSPEGTYVNEGEPGYGFLGKKVYSPFGIPAGPLLNAKHVKKAFDSGYDVVCYKTQRSAPFACNEFPNILYLDIDGDLTLEKAAHPQVGHLDTTHSRETLSITNSFGNPSRGPGFWKEDIKKALSYRGKGQLLIVSVVGTIKPGFTAEQYYDDFAETAELVAGCGVEAIELNLSCPNVASEGVLCYTHDAVVAIAQKVRERIGDIPLIAKLGYFSEDQQELLESIIKDSAPYLSAYSAINTISAPIVDADGNQALPGEGRLKSGVCGASVRWAGLDMVRRLSELRSKLGLRYEIIGVGGVMSVDDFNAYRGAGADVVQSATGAMWNQALAAEVKASL
jgi:dihydroorotate dehydrogenase